MGFRRSVRSVFVPGGINTIFIYGNDAVHAKLIMTSIVDLQFAGPALMGQGIVINEHGVGERLAPGWGIPWAETVYKAMRDQPPAVAARLVWTGLKEALLEHVNGPRES